jgi:cell wall-associated NlpC family hydrolase
VIKNHKQLLPGDLIFYANKKNGRYKNISHVSIYCGNGMIVHASGSKRGVVREPYVLRKDTVLVARPVR